MQAKLMKVVLAKDKAVQIIFESTDPELMDKTMSEIDLLQEADVDLYFMLRLRPDELIEQKTFAFNAREPQPCEDALDEPEHCFQCGVPMGTTILLLDGKKLCSVACLKEREAQIAAQRGPAEPVQFPDAKDLFDTLLPGVRLWFDDSGSGLMEQSAQQGIIRVVALAMGDTIEVLIEETGEPCIYSREDINTFCTYRLPEEVAEAQGGPAAATTDEAEAVLPCSNCECCAGSDCEAFVDDDLDPQEQPQEAADEPLEPAGDAGEVTGAELPAIDDIIVRNKRGDDETACFLRVVSHSGETFRAVNLHDASAVSPISLGAYKQFYRHATEPEIVELFEQGLLAIDAPAPQAASEPLPAVAYLDPAGMPVFVHTGINDRETGPFGAFRLKLNGSVSRVVSKHLPMQETRDAAQADLDAWAFPSMKAIPVPDGYGPPESVVPGADLMFETIKHKKAPTCYLVTDSSSETGESTLEPVGGGEAITITRGNHTEYEKVQTLKQI